MFGISPDQLRPAKSSQQTATANSSTQPKAIAPLARPVPRQATADKKTVVEADKKTVVEARQVVERPGAPADRVDDSAKTVLGVDAIQAGVQAAGADDFAKTVLGISAEKAAGSSKTLPPMHAEERQPLSSARPDGAPLPVLAGNSVADLDRRSPRNAADLAAGVSLRQPPLSSAEQSERFGQATTGPSILGSIPLKQSGLCGLRLDDDEQLIAVERPGAVFWLLFGLSCAFVVTLPLALWLLFKAAGKAYVITNRRVVRIERSGKIRQILLRELAEYEVVGFFPLRRVSLRLWPSEGSGVKPLRFELCGPDGALSRLSGAIDFWIRNPGIDIKQAPAVNAQGRLNRPSHELDIAVFADSRLAQGPTARQPGRHGVAVLTPAHLYWLRDERRSNLNGCRQQIPVYHFVQGVAERSRSIDDFEAHLIKLSDSEIVSGSICRAWTDLDEMRYRSGKGLQFLDRAQGVQGRISLPHRDASALRRYLNGHGISLG